MLKNVLRICAAVGVIHLGLSNCEDTPAKWATEVLQSDVSVNSLKSIVEGFDFNPKEMENLKLWDHGIVLYYIDTVSFDKVLRDRIRTFLDVTSGLTGLQFLELPSPPEDLTTRWVFFVNRRGQLECADHSLANFTTEGVQKVLLGYDCLTNKGELAEVVLSLAGVPHQHKSPDRDEYITVNFDKIIPEKRYLFEKVPDSAWLFHDLEHDFSSAGHFHYHKHTIDGSATITPKKPTDALVGEGNGFSYTDILKIRMLYNYIRKPKTNELSSNCKKLFKPGTDLKKNYPRPKSNKKDLPSVKPKKYRAANQDYDFALKDPNNAKTPEKIDNDDVGSKENEKSDAEVVDDNDEAEEITVNDDVQDKSTEAGAPNEKLLLKQNHKKRPKDPLADLSDYETDDGKKRGKNKRRKPKKLKTF